MKHNKIKTSVEGGKELKKLAVIADDLTGANDTGVQFAKKSKRTVVFFSKGDESLQHLTGDVLVFNSDSRAVPPTKAHQIVKTLAHQVKQAGISTVFKKIDSTLRGNIGAEIDAILDVFAFEVALVVPAFPKGKRTTKMGRQYVNNVPVEETELAQDPSCPVLNSNIKEAINEQSLRKVDVITLQDVRQGHLRLISKMKTSIQQKHARILVIDAETEEDLATIVRASEDLDGPFLWVGTAGIAGHLEGDSNRRQPSFKSAAPCLLVAGSVKTITHQQIHTLKQHIGIEEIIISPEKLLHTESKEKEIQRVIQESSRFLKGESVIISTNIEVEVMKEIDKVKEKMKLTNIEVGARIAEAMGEVAKSLIERFPLSGVILTGGDIAASTCTKLEGTGIEVSGEVESGMPYGRLLGGKYDGLPLVTKSGGFGSEKAFIKAIQLLKGTAETA